MKAHYEASGVTVFHGDCLDVLRELPDESVHAVVTDPPYGLEFMGKAWDSFGREDAASDATAGMSRTGYTDGGNRIERPSFLGGINPRCKVCGKSQRGGSPCTCERPNFTDERGPRLRAFQGWCEEWARECRRVLKPGGHLLAFGGSRTWHRLAAGIEDAGFEMRDSIAWLYGSGFPKSLDVGKAMSDWTGWGTALKPAFEPIVVARKSLAGTVAANVLAHGTGALNIDASRVAWGEGGDKSATRKAAGYSDTARKALGNTVASESATGFTGEVVGSDSSSGRWPANVVLDESQAVELDRQAPDTGGSGRASGPSLTGATSASAAYGARNGVESTPFYGDRGGASRMFPTFRYEAKAPTSERPVVDGVAHPTVKPLDLMRWLVRLVTPKGGTVLEPFAGSGTTVEACIREGFDVIAIEREADYLPLIEKRIRKDHAQGLDFDWGEAS